MTPVACLLEIAIKLDFENQTRCQLSYKWKKMIVNTNNSSEKQTTYVICETMETKVMQLSMLGRTRLKLRQGI